MLVAFPALLFVARPAIPLRLLLGYGLTIGLAGCLLFCAIGQACRRGWRRWCCRRKPFLPSFLAPSSGERLQGKQLAGIALAIFGVLVLVEEPRREHVPLVGFMLTLAAALSWATSNIFKQKSVPGDPPANHIAGGVGL